jgi:ABC-type proline/glycine betaine transport system ATPase subunit
MLKFQERFKKVKEKIRQAIVAKGVDVPEDASLADMANLIDEIKISKINKRKEKE